MRDFPGRLHHNLPPWVSDSSCFHVRVRCHSDNPRPLTNAELAPKLLDSVRRYTEHGGWWPHLFLLMPDHLHALLCFPVAASMSSTISDWKRFHARQHAVLWQTGYFDHRLRRDESLVQKAAYLRNNPVAKGLCEEPDDWPWLVAL